MHRRSPRNNPRKHQRRPQLGEHFRHGGPVDAQRPASLRSTDCLNRRDLAPRNARLMGICRLRICNRGVRTTLSPTAPRIPSDQMHAFAALPAPNPPIRTDHDERARHRIEHPPPPESRRVASFRSVMSAPPAPTHFPRIARAARCDDARHATALRILSTARTR